jgi:hypothetical protein
MATYLETLIADRERQRQALTALIESEAAQVRELQASVAAYSKALDEQIVRLMVLRGLFGPSSQDTLNAEVEVEEASKPHTAALAELARRQRILQALQEALIRLNQGETVDGGATGPGKLTVADILES